MSPPRQLAESLLAECDALEAEIVRLNNENDRMLDDAEIIDGIVARQKVEIDELKRRAEQAERERDGLKRLIAANARDEAGHVSMPLAGLRKLDELRARADAAERRVEVLAFAASGAEEFLQKQFSSLSMAGVKWLHPGAQKAYAALEAALAALAAAEVEP